MATIYDVAKKAGVSIATVSRVLHGKEHIRESTRKKVMDAVQELEYSPDMAAQMLSGSTAKNILVIIPLHPVNSGPCVRGIISVAEEKGYHVLLGYQDPQNLIGLPLQDLRDTNLIAGVIFQGYLNGLEDLPAPAVVISEFPQTQYPYTVVSNDRKGVYEVTRELIRKGKKRFVFLSSLPEGLKDFTQFPEQRFCGMQDALREAGLFCDDSLLTELTTPRLSANASSLNGTYPQAVGYAMKIVQMPKEERPEVIICAYDSIAMALINTFKEHGIRVPEDIMVSGYDNSDLSLYTDPHITTVASNFMEMGAQAAKMLFTLMAGKEPEQKYVSVEPQIFLRESTGHTDEG